MTLETMPVSIEMNTQICLLLAAERSGTHLLRSMLNTAPEVAAPGEICNAAQDPAGAGKLSFLKFRESACLADRRFFYPSLSAQEILLDRYCDFVRHNTGNSIVVLDVKYSHVLNFNAFWWDYLEPPFLLQYARKHGFKIIHLVRRKVYRTAVSGLYAQVSGVWRAQSSDELNAVQIRVDRRKLDKRVRQIVHQISLFEKWLHRCDFIDITYEDLTAAPEDCLSRLRDFFGLQGGFSNAPGFIKTTPPLEEAILNIGEISELIDLDWRDARGRLMKRPPSPPERVRPSRPPRQQFAGKNRA